MPDGATHLKIWKRRMPVSIFIGVSIAVLLQSPIFAAGVIGGYLSGRYITPDLDLITVTSDEGRMMRELKIMGLFMVMLFFPYAYFMRFIGIGRKGHRNFFSHFPGVGTIIRIAWVLSLPAIAWFYFGKPIYSWMPYGLLGVFVGLTLADVWHYVADMTYRRR